MFNIYLPADIWLRKWLLCYKNNVKRQTECARNNKILHNTCAYKRSFVYSSVSQTVVRGPQRSSGSALVVLLD